MSKIYSRFKVKVKSPESGIKLGFAESEGYVFAVVPRFWFGEKIPYGILDSSKVLVVPGKGDRTFLTEESKIPSEKVIVPTKKDGMKKWISIGEIDAQKSLNSDKVTKIKDDQALHTLALFNLLTEKPLPKKNKESLRKSIFSLSSSTSEFRIFLFKAVIDVVTKEMRELRRSYKEIKVQSSSIRGRIDFNSSIPLIAAKIPEMVCVTEEFALNAPHYGALMTAFDYIASSSNTGETFLKKLVTDVSNNAMITRARFREIPSMPYGQALRTLRNVPIPPQLRQWKALFGFARLVLEGDGAKITAGDNVENTYTWSGAKLWEDILEKVIQAKFADDVKVYSQDKISMETPWVRTSDRKLRESDKKPEFDKKPDVVVSKDDLDLVIDAKYYDEVGKVMSSNNYQMLGYALGALKIDEESRVGRRKVAFVAPHRKSPVRNRVDNNEEHAYEMRLPFTIIAEEDLYSSGKITPTLQGLSMEFPSPEVFIDPDSSKAYYDEVGEKMNEILLDFFRELWVWGPRNRQESVTE
jgi:5-methylcytosine-specific restriction endonuclease McrBC regulatory subunit McrC